MIIDILHGHLINSRCRELQALVTARIVCEGCFYRCVSVDRGGVCLSLCWDTTTPRGRPPQEADPLGSRPLQEGDPPRSRHPQEAYPSRSRPSKKETPTPKSRSPLQAHMKGGNLGGSRPTPPAPHRACWEIRSTRGRYVSYWNEILLQFTCTSGGST